MALESLNASLEDEHTPKLDEFFPDGVLVDIAFYRHCQTHDQPRKCFAHGFEELQLGWFRD